jgi:hypothetical protein
MGEGGYFLARWEKGKFSGCEFCRGINRPSRLELPSTRHGEREA